MSLSQERLAEIQAKSGFDGSHYPDGCDVDELVAEVRLQAVQIATLKAELARFEPAGVSMPTEPPGMIRTVEAVEHALIGWRGRALRAERQLAEAHLRLREIALAEADRKLG